VVNNLLEVDADCTAVYMWMVVTGVNQNTDLLRPDLGRSIAKHKQHWVNHVRLSAAVWSDDRREILQPRQYEQITSCSKWD